MATSIEGTTKMANPMAREFTNGQTEPNTKGLSKTGLEKGRGAGSVKAETSTKATSVLTAKTGLGSLGGPMATSTRVISAKTCARVSGKWSGEMAAFTRDSGDGDFPTAEVIDCIISQEPSELLAKNPESGTSRTTSWSLSLG
jgi:hypothetical protein